MQYSFFVVIIIDEHLPNEFFIWKKYFFERIIKMNKSQLIDVVAKNTGLKKKDVEVAVVSFVDAIADALIAGEKVQISGLGSFEVKTKAPRIGRNPKTQEVISIPTSKRPTFTASKTLKETINK